MSDHRFLVVNGPNLNLLGEREPAIYGAVTLDEIESACRAWGEEHGVPVCCFQSNAEGALLDFLQAERHRASGAVLNAAAYTHTSVALHDGVRALPFPVIEVHMSNVAAREPFRAVSLIAPVARGTITGLGALGYLLALEALRTMTADAPEERP
jgi:3-dehydroquinate dehydratase-2